jgi:hypothetical protein
VDYVLSYIQKGGEWLEIRAFEATAPTAMSSSSVDQCHARRAALVVLGPCLTAFDRGVDPLVPRATHHEVVAQLL